ncbi:protein of unknown function [Acidithiobacillus ferrivorans]|uniref:Uncharacterized protein n=1 Tax=Acidithiobacillus ferrivorans TaxID=160808 RepID=A0A060US18_9PROT|nr:hypothetical protein AFERRI_30005 [Acidithiobacillus ferrivorans]SMH66293.1 protein of unknown function [Acidithiobacillus ferrivorans]
MIGGKMILFLPSRGGSVMQSKHYSILTLTHQFPFVGIEKRGGDFRFASFPGGLLDFGLGHVAHERRHLLQALQCVFVPEQRLFAHSSTPSSGAGRGLRLRAQALRQSSSSLRT